MLARAAAVAILAGASFGAQCQETPEPTVHWAYASFFGTGWYKLADQGSSFIVNVAPRKTFGEAGFDDEGRRTIAWTLRTPVSIGVNQFDVDNIPGIIDFNNFATASVGVAGDADVPVTRRFSLRPIAELGYGRVLGKRESAWTYRAEVRGRYEIDTETIDTTLLGSAGFVGFEPNTGSRDAFSFVTLAAEFDHPVGWFDEDDESVFYWHLAYTEFLDEVEYQITPDRFDTVTNYWQLGVAFGKEERPLKFWFLRFDRLGLAYDLSASGDFRGIKLIFRSWYDR